jgi:hypothetical protein
LYLKLGTKYDMIIPPGSRREEQRIQARDNAILIIALPRMAEISRGGGPLRYFCPRLAAAGSFAAVHPSSQR